MDDDSLFAEAMGKVRPLASEKRVAATKNRPKAHTVVRERGPKQMVPVDGGHRMQGTEDAWVFAASGISREKLKRLAAGRPAVSHTFDLHGANREEALSLLERGFSEAVAEGCRALAIIHGRGLHSGGKPVLKAAVYQWLREGSFAHAVLAVVPQPGSGGGACLVLLRRKQ